MSEQQGLTQVNAEFLSTRAARLDGAIAKALEAKLPPAPKARPATLATPQRAAAPAAASPAATDSSSPASSATTEEAAGAVPDELAELGASAADPVEAEAAEADPGAAAVAPELAELQELGSKADLRALEKKLGLKEGILGVKNGDYAAYRRRCEAVEARAGEVETTHQNNQATLIQKFGPAVDLIQHAQRGNLQAYALTIQRTTGISIEAFIAHFAKNVQQLSPRELALEQENTRLRLSTPPSTPQDTAPAAVPAEAAVKKANDYLTAEAAGHAALKLKGGLDEVRAKWLASYDKASGSFKLAPKAAADAVVEDRRKLREQEAWVLSGKTPPKVATTRAIPRLGSSQTQPRTQNKTREQLIEEGARAMRAGKAAERRGR